MAKTAGEWDHDRYLCLHSMRHRAYGFDKRDQAFDGALCASIEEQSQVCIHRGIMSSMKDTSAATF